MFRWQGGEVEMFSKYTVPVICALYFCNVGCALGVKVDSPLVPASYPVTVSSLEQAVSSPVMESPAPGHVHVSQHPFFVVDSELDAYAYPAAIATQEDIILEVENATVKRDAYLALVALHMNRVNPNQNFFAASLALDHAVELDPSLLGGVVIQRWQDVFSLLLDLRKGGEAVPRLQDDNDMLRATIKKQKRTITYLETTLEELKKIDHDVAEKKRSYR